MGLSRNKVAVSEGAAGSPPFYGERENMEVFSYSQRKQKDDEKQSVKKSLLFDFQGLLKSPMNMGV